MSSTPPLRRNLALLLLQARDSVMARFRPILNAHGLTEQQWRVLRALMESGTLEPREIGRVCSISSPSLAGVLARMEQTGLVRRTKLDHDQRRQAVSPTAKGRALVARIAPQIETAYAAIEDGAGVALMADLQAALDRLIAALGKPA